MPSFDDVLKDNLELAKADEAFKKRVPEIKARWLTDLAALRDCISGYLQKSVDAGLLKIEYLDVDIKEEMFGLYKAPALKILSGDKGAVFDPFGMYNTSKPGEGVVLVAPTGVVSPGFCLLRVPQGSNFVWYFNKIPSDGRDEDDDLSLNRENLEAVLAHILSL